MTTTLAWHDWRPEFLLFALGFVTLATGAGVLETIAHVMNFTGAAHWVEVGFEEGFEMLGVSIMAFSGFRVLSRSVRWPGDSEADTSAGSDLP